jgi:hypothetical protein
VEVWRSASHHAAVLFPVVAGLVKRKRRMAATYPDKYSQSVIRKDPETFASDSAQKTYILELSHMLQNSISLSIS